MRYLSLLFFILFGRSHLEAIPTQPMGDWYPTHFSFYEDITLCQQIVQTMNLELSSSILDLDYVDGTLRNDAILNGISYLGASPYADIVAGSAGNAILLDPFEYFDLGVTFDWVVCVALPGLYPSNNTAMFIDNLKRHANQAIVVTWFSRNDSSPYFFNQKIAAEVEEAFMQQGLTRDLATENLLRSSANPLNFWPQILYVFRP